MPVNLSELLDVLQRAETALGRKSPPPEPERLELWRDIGYQVRDVERALAADRAPRSLGEAVGALLDAPATDQADRVVERPRRVRIGGAA